MDVSQDFIRVTEPASIGADSQPTSRVGEGGVLWRVLRSHWDMKGATRAMLESKPSETRLLMLLILACLTIYAGRAFGLMIMGGDDLLARVGVNFIAAIMFGIPSFYGVAALCGLIARAFGGEASWRECRTAVFWAALATAPVVFATTVLSAVLAAGGEFARVVELAGSVYFGFAFCVAVAMANKFRTAWGVFGVTAAVLAVIFCGLWLLLGDMA